MQTSIRSQPRVSSCPAMGSGTNKRHIPTHTMDPCTGRYSFGPANPMSQDSSAAFRGAQENGTRDYIILPPPLGRLLIVI